MKSKIPTHDCTSCGGTGYQALSPILFQAYAAIPPKRGVTVEKIAAKIGTSLQTANQRLFSMLRLKVVSRERVGKKYLYSRK